MTFREVLGPGGGEQGLVWTGAPLGTLGDCLLAVAGPQACRGSGDKALCGSAVYLQHVPPAGPAHRRGTHLRDSDCPSAQALQPGTHQRSAVAASTPPATVTSSGWRAGEQTVAGPLHVGTWWGTQRTVVALDGSRQRPTPPSTAQWVRRLPANASPRPLHSLPPPCRPCSVRTTSLGSPRAC